MKITKNQLKRLIKEEAHKLAKKQHNSPAPMKSRATPEVRAAISNAEMQERLRNSNIKENLYGPGSRERWEDYRRQHVAELAEILEMYPDMAESESDLREYWEGVIHDALKLAFM